MLTVWLVVGSGALLLLGVLGFGLFGQGKRLNRALGEAQAALAPQVAEMSQGIRRIQAMRTPDGADTTHGHGRHA